MPFNGPIKVLSSLFVATILSGTLLLPSATRAATETAEMNFQSGVDAFQKKDYAKARAAFLAAAEREGDTPLLLYNLGLVESRLGEKGLALALWRKALVRKPFDSGLKSATSWVQPKLEHPEIPHEVELWESFRTIAIAPVALDHYVMATAAFLLISGWLFLRYFGRRRVAKIDEASPPGFPLLAGICGLLFICSAILSSAKALDSQILRGTITTKKIEARSSPQMDATSLFELYEGLEVIVRRMQTEGGQAWAQVTYPGAATGWIPRETLFTTDDATKDRLKAETKK